MREIRVDHVSKSFGKAKALDDVSLSFEHGKIHALLGRNGAGKSTLLGLIANRLVPRAAASSWTTSPPPTTREPWPSCTA
ncbi:MAG: ATP-binding cassette domain-containing protein [Eggerthella lenta]